MIIGLNVEDIVDAREVDTVFPPSARNTLRADARSLSHLLRHKPKRLYCESCRRTKLKAQRKYVGAFQNTATFWGQHLSGDRIVTIGDLCTIIGGVCGAPCRRNAGAPRRCRLAPTVLACLAKTVWRLPFGGCWILRLFGVFDKFFFNSHSCEIIFAFM